MDGEGSISPIKNEDMFYIWSMHRKLENVFHEEHWNKISTMEFPMPRYVEDVPVLPSSNLQERCTIHKMHTQRQFVALLSPCGHFNNCDSCIIGKYLFLLKL